MTIKVLHVLDHSHPKTDGYAIRSKYIIENQQQLGLQPSVVTSMLHSIDNQNGVCECINGTQYYRTSGTGGAIEQVQLGKPFLRERLLMRRLYDQIVSILKRGQFDVIHAHSPSLCGLPALKAAKKHGIPFVYEVRAFWEDAATEQKKYSDKSLRYKLSRYLETRVFRLADCVVTISQQLANDIVSRGIDASKVFLVPNAVDVRKFAPREKHHELMQKHGTENCVVLGFIGSFFEFEGLACLIQAMNIVVRENKQARLLVVGDGIESGNIKKMVNCLGLTDRVILVGQVPHEEVINYYSIMDILVYPRLRHRLTELVTPLKPLEAMAMKKAVLGSDVGGIIELLNLDGDLPLGVLFEADNVNDLAKKLDKLINKRVYREAIAHAGHVAVRERRSWEVVAARYLQIYDYAIANY